MSNIAALALEKSSKAELALMKLKKSYLGVAESKIEEALAETE
ncbi:MAG: hypothetical protein ACYTDT_01710 [Planctomycetota bacterium]|jgi:hypothetical protein